MPAGQDGIFPDQPVSEGLVPSESLMALLLVGGAGEHVGTALVSGHQLCETRQRFPSVRVCSACLQCELKGARRGGGGRHVRSLAWEPHWPLVPWPSPQSGLGLLLWTRCGQGPCSGGGRVLRALREAVARAFRGLTQHREWQSQRAGSRSRRWRPGVGTPWLRTGALGRFWEGPTQ